MIESSGGGSFGRLITGEPEGGTHRGVTGGDLRGDLPCPARDAAKPCRGGSSTRGSMTRTAQCRRTRSARHRRALPLGELLSDPGTGFGEFCSLTGLIERGRPHRRIAVPAQHHTQQANRAMRRRGHPAPDTRPVRYQAVYVT